MTVCVATIANNGLIVGAADRMLTAGVKQTEPASAKIYHLPNRAVSLMWAGSASVQGQLWDDFYIRLASSPDAYPNVKDVVDLYCSIYGTIRAKMAEATFLAPLQLNTASLVSRQTKLDPNLLSDLQHQMTHFALPDDEALQALIVGMDPDGAAHIWSVSNGRPCCHDLEGFGAIGIGFDHADSQLRFSRYTRMSLPLEAVILTYFAKRRAEVAPGVGRATDMFTRAPGTHLWERVPDEWMGEFERIYKQLVDSETRGLKRAVTRTKGFFDKLFTPPALHGDGETDDTEAIQWYLDHEKAIPDPRVGYRVRVNDLHGVWGFEVVRA